MTDTPSFPGFEAAAFAWLDDIAADNSRDGFAALRPTYDADVREPFATLLAECAAWCGGEPRVFRQLHDLRFEKHRQKPYWESIAGEVTWPGRVTAWIVQLSADGLTAMAGCRRAFRPDELARYRAAVDEDGPGVELDDITRSLDLLRFSVCGSTLRGMPRGFSADHPRAALLRHTAFYGASTLPPSRRRRGRRSIPRDAALAHLSAAWADLEPLVVWLDEHVGQPSPVVQLAA